MIFLAVSHMCISLFPPLLNAQSAFLQCLLILLLRNFTTHHVMISTLYVLDAVFPTEPASPGQRPFRFAVFFIFFLIWTLSGCCSDFNVNLLTASFAAPSHRQHLFHSNLLLFSGDTWEVLGTRMVPREPYVWMLVIKLVKLFGKD